MLCYIRTTIYVYIYYIYTIAQFKILQTTNLRDLMHRISTTNIILLFLHIVIRYDRYKQLYI